MELGQWFRKRYDGFLSQNYNESELLVYSSYVNRTKVSAKYNLAGLYPDEPFGSIPIQVASSSILSSEEFCVKLIFLLAKTVFTDEHYKNIQSENAELYTYLSEMTGSLDLGLIGVYSLRDTLFVENEHNLTLPEWTNGIFPEKLDPIAAAAFALLGYTVEIQQLMSGHLLNEAIERFVNIVNGEDLQKFVIYSGHDANIAGLLSVFGTYAPPFLINYADTIIFELRNNSLGPYVNIFYKSRDGINPIELEDCGVACLLDDFRSSLLNVTITHTEWLKKCYLP